MSMFIGVSGSVELFDINLNTNNPYERGEFTTSPDASLKDELVKALSSHRDIDSMALGTRPTAIGLIAALREVGYDLMLPVLYDELLEKYKPVENDEEPSEVVVY